MILLTVYFVILISVVFYNDGIAQITIPRTPDPPIIDGRVNDIIWESGAKINEFFQREPNEGEPLTEKTEVFILYDFANIYFGLKCYQNPGLQSRFRWILKPGNEIFLVWNSVRSVPGSLMLMNENVLRLKIKYNIRF